MKGNFLYTSFPLLIYKNNPHTTLVLRIAQPVFNKPKINFMRKLMNNLYGFIHICVSQQPTVLRQPANWQPIYILAAQE